MLTYQLQDRTFCLKQGEKFTFPNKLVIKIVLAPTAQFGVENLDPSLDPGFSGDRHAKTTFVGSEANLHFYLNIGQHVLSVKNIQKPLNVVSDSLEQSLKCSGNEIILTTKCRDIKQLVEIITDLHYNLPIILNLEFFDPPIVKQTSGKLGNVDFTWDMLFVTGDFKVTTLESQEKLVVNAFNRFPMFTNGANRRLLNALQYFHVACRLEATGNSPWEFMSESVLNYCKVLQIMFGEKRDEVREGLKKLGYEETEIEGIFMPIMILRDYFDVGHPSLVILEFKQLQILYRYLEKIQSQFRELIMKVFAQLQKDTNRNKYDLDAALQPDKQEQRKFDAIISNIKKSMDKTSGISKKSLT